MGNEDVDERVRLEALGRATCPKTLALVAEYAEGPEKERARNLVITAITEMLAFIDAITRTKR